MKVSLLAGVNASVAFDRIDWLFASEDWQRLTDLSEILWARDEPLWGNLRRHRPGVDRHRHLRLTTLG